MFKTVFLCVLHVCAASKVLVVFPVPSRSHTMLGDSLINNLLQAGHEVTYVTTLTSVKDVNLKLVNISSPLYSVIDRESIRLAELVRKPRPSQKILEVGSTFARRALQHEAMQQLILDPDISFDLVIAEWFYTGLLAPLASVYSCPLIWYSAVDVSWMNLQLVHGHTNPAYTVDTQSRSWASSYDVLDKVRRLWRQMQLMVWSYYYTNYVEAPIYLEVYRPVMEVRGLALPDYESLVYNGSLMLVNSNPLLSQGMPLPQNVKLVGGHHIEQTKPTMKNWQQLLDNSAKGVIIFNLGANIKGKDLTAGIKKRLLDVFGHLEQTVIWVFPEQLEKHSRNIHIVKSVPQISILNHTNTLIFITSGDLSSCLEATYFGVPIVGVPLFGEQFLMTDLVAARRRGLRVDFNDDLPENIRDAIYDILHNNSFRNNMQKASAVFQNQLVHPQDEVLHWIELTIKHGVDHLLSPAVHLSIFQKLYLDVLALVVMFLWFLTKVVKVVRVHWSHGNDVIEDEKKDQ